MIWSTTHGDKQRRALMLGFLLLAAVAAAAPMNPLDYTSLFDALS